MVPVLKGSHRLSDVAADRVFHALSHATRRDILLRSIDREESVSALARHYSMSLTAVRKHVGVLEAAGLVQRRVAGREHRVHVDEQTLRQATALLADFERLWRSRVAAMVSNLAEEAPKA